MSRHFLPVRTPRDAFLDAGIALVLLAPFMLGACLWGCSPEPAQPDPVVVSVEDVPLVVGEAASPFLRVEDVPLVVREGVDETPRVSIGLGTSDEPASGVFFPRDLRDSTDLVWQPVEPTWGATYDHETSTLTVGRWKTIGVVGRVFELPGGYRVRLPVEAVEVPR